MMRLRKQSVINWLLDGDVSIRFQVERDLLERMDPGLQTRIGLEGWGANYLRKRKANGHWGHKFYQPKWTSTHYTLLDLRNLCIRPDHPLVCESVDLIANNEKGTDGGINPSGSIKQSDVCINGMFLNYASYFHVNQLKLESVVDFIISQQMPDGGFNCRFNRSGARHSSLHSSLSVLEGITEYIKNNYDYRIQELKEIRESAKEFILKHQLFISDRTGEIIKREFLRFTYPPRWKYNILRALDYFRYAGDPWDPRMKPALLVLLKKQKKDGRWLMNAKYPGKEHFSMEKAGKKSRWISLIAMRVLKTYKKHL